MKLFFRLFWLIVTQRWRSRCDIQGPVDTRLRVYPNDLDVMLHANNGVYLTYADLGRIDLLLRSGAFGKFRRQGWYPVVAAATIEYKQSLKLGQVFTIRTRILGWDDKAIYLGQEFLRGDSLVARMMIDARFLSRRGGKVTTNDLSRVLGVPNVPPELPAALQQWLGLRRRRTVVEKPTAEEVLLP